MFVSSSHETSQENNLDLAKEGISISIFCEEPSCIVSIALQVVWRIASSDFHGDVLGCSQAYDLCSVKVLQNREPTFKLAEEFKYFDVNKGACKTSRDCLCDHYIAVRLPK